MGIPTEGQDSKFSWERRYYFWDCSGDLSDVQEEAVSGQSVHVFDEDDTDVTADTIEANTLTLIEDKYVGARFINGTPGELYYMRLRVSTNLGNVYGRYWQIRINEG